MLSLGGTAETFLHSREAYVKLRTDYESIIHGLNAAVKKLWQESDELFFLRKRIIQQRADVEKPQVRFCEGWA